MEPVTAAAHLDRLRPELVRRTRAVHNVIMNPDAGSILSEIDRGRIALRVAAVNADHDLVDRFRDRLCGLGDRVGAEVVTGPPELWDQLGEPSAVLLAHAEQVALDPADSDRAEIAELITLGWDDSAIVAAAQVVGYVSYRSRLERGLAVLAAGAQPGAARPDPLDGQPDVLRSAQDKSVGAAEWPPFLQTLAPGADRFPVLDWSPWVEPAAVPAAAPGSDARTPARWSPFYLTLLHDPAVLAARTELYNAIMTGPGALDRADRELVALATSLVTGCAYCASVHGRRAQQLINGPDPAAALASRGPAAITEPRPRALIALAARTAITPTAIEPSDLDRLRRGGLADAEIADAIAVAAMFTWANRLMLTLGSP